MLKCATQGTMPLESALDQKKLIACLKGIYLFSYCPKKQCFHSLTFQVNVFGFWVTGLSWLIIKLILKT